MDTSAVSPGTSAVPAHPWLTSPLKGVIGRFGIAFLFPVLEATLLITLLALALPVALLQVYDRILPNKAVGTLAVLATTVAIAILLEAVMRHVRAKILARVAATSETQAHRQAMQRLLNAPLAALEAHGNGYYAERLSAIGTLREAWSGPALQAMLDLPFALLYLVGIWYLAGSLVLVPLALLAGVALVAALTGRWVRRAAHDLALAEERRFNFLFDTLGCIHAMKVLGTEPLLERRYERLQSGSAQMRRKLARTIAAGQEGGLLLAQAATIGVAAYGCQMVLNGQLSVGGLGACTMLVGRTMQPLLGGVALWSRLQSLAESRRRVAEIGALPQEHQRDRPTLQVHAGQVRLQDVSFRSASHADWLFDGVTLDIAAGEVIGITGSNGSGRSSLLRLIAGDLRPNGGSVWIDGQNLAQTNIGSVRRLVALVPPDPALVRGTLLQNLTMHQPEREAAALRFATELGLDQVASSLPGGWHTPVGVAATPLPRGAAQRIAIVRALIEEPRILLLDDITSQLDADSDARLARLLARLRGEVTVVIVTHRPSTLSIADRVFAIRSARLEPAS
ncbi:peptidase domain-containing ABC transporter [Microvirga arsenatis]|uniref:ATP-binding cassette domain-containing protein n=1 Tax=Microvirga arsenatis TaxID=2692265 RepID=A0ABW9YZW9_9HYPH|nr:ATP-binding cassette domain-containing protein [Microvirga arsenatis]NBJ11109.1 ATP-binding cassette domain-containing protein [Microvirga arsenatis]NBJ25382.1 ATP-binding cassette domain-containing protein [Microvirga arsenatis]